MSKVCPTCGTPEALHAQFCTSCGRRLADTEDEGAGALPSGVVPSRSSGPSRGVRRSRTWLVAAGAVVGVAAIAAIITTVLRGSGASGGAKSPAEAVTVLAEALSADDLLAAVDVVAPDEAAGVHGLLTAIKDRAAVEQVPGLTGGEGIDVDIEVGSPSVNEVGDHAAIVGVDIDARLTSSTTGPLGLVLPAASEDSVQLEVVTVRIDGGWYVSPLLTLGHVLVERHDLPRGDYRALDDDRELGDGADDPDAAVDQLFESIAESDVDAAIDVLGTGEARFGRVFGDAIEELLDEVPEDRVAYQGSSLEDLGDGRRHVRGAELEITADDGSVTDVEVDDDCITVSSPGDVDEGERERRVCLTRHLDLLAPLERDGVVLRTVDAAGGHRVAVLASAADHATELVATLPRDALFAVLDAEHLDTATPLPIGGDDVAFDLSDRLYQTFEFPVTAGMSYQVTRELEDGESWDEVFLRNAEGVWQREYADVLRPEVDGIARVVVHAHGDCSVVCMPDGGTGSLRVRQAGTQDVAFPATYAGELGAGDLTILAFDVPNAEHLYIDVVNGEVATQVIDADGRVVATTSSSFEAPPGRYELVVTNRGSERTAFEVLATTAAAATTFTGGRTSVDVPLASSTPIELAVVAGTAVEVHAVGDDDQDIELHILWPDGTECHADDVYGSRPERCEAEMSVSGTATVTVSAYGFDDYGNANVTVSAS